jgi:oligosaccharyltransferase complex subunit alpha (ribophorin I)
MRSRLKGHFSRLVHQQSRFHSGVPPQVLTDLSLTVSASARSAYYYDVIGNVSTSNFREGFVSKKGRSVDGHLDLRPRYPLLGGWNYSFVVGYDMPLGDVLKVDGAKKVLGVPFLTAVKDIVFDDVEMTIILPEGAK